MHLEATSSGGGQQASEPEEGPRQGLGPSREVAKGRTAWLARGGWGRTQAGGKAGRLRPASANQAVTEETVETYRMAKAFLMGEWYGAILMVLSFTQLYWGILGKAYSGRLAVVGGVVFLALGAVVFWRSRTYYLRLDFPWKKRWETAATLLAGAGAMFWLLLGVVWGLTAVGYQVGPLDK